MMPDYIKFRIPAITSRAVLLKVNIWAIKQGSTNSKGLKLEYVV